jgi:hypothetical protein
MRSSRYFAADHSSQVKALYKLTISLGINPGRYSATDPIPSEHSCISSGNALSPRSRLTITVKKNRRSIQMCNSIDDPENEETANIYSLCPACRHLSSIPTSFDLAGQNNTGPCMEMESRAYYWPPEFWRPLSRRHVDGSCLMLYTNDLRSFPTRSAR